MKQGRAQTSMVGSTKTEPVSKAVNPGAVKAKQSEKPEGK